MQDQPTLYPLRFTPIYQYRLWGGHRFEKLLSTPLPGTDPIGEAWILSDRDDHASRVAEGSLRGRTIRELIAEAPEAMLGKFAKKYDRFPLLLKFLDAREMLSVQVHPTDDQPELLPPGEAGKTEAWVVLEADPESRIYAGLQSGTTQEDLRHLTADSADNHLASFSPKPGDGLFIPAGTVHALGGGVVVFEVQENSDVTFRLFDWDRVDAHTGKPRELHIEKALQCIDVAQGALGPVQGEIDEIIPVLREKLFDCEHFTTWRLTGVVPFWVGAEDEPRAVVCLEGKGIMLHSETKFPIQKGDTYLIPASVGRVDFEPDGRVIVLETALPDHT